MFIQTETTPNPATVKFIPGVSVCPGESVDFRLGDSFSGSPLAQRLFTVPGVVRVFLGEDFVSVTKAEDQDWSSLKPFVLAALMEHFTSGMPALKARPVRSSSVDPMEVQIVAQIRALLEARVRPAVARDGGDVVFHRFEDGVVYLEMRGACSGCPGASATLKLGVERMLQHYIPEVREVRPVEEEG